MAKIFCKAYLTINAKQAILNTKLTLHRKGGIILETRIPELRKKRKISQEELALEVGVTRQTITSIEVGKYSASLLLAHKIAKFFDLAIEDVFIFTQEDEE